MLRFPLGEQLQAVAVAMPVPAWGCLLIQDEYTHHRRVAIYSEKRIFEKTYRRGLARSASCLFVPQTQLARQALLRHTNPVHFDAFSAATSDKHDAFRHTLHEIHERIKLLVLVNTKH